MLSCVFCFYVILLQHEGIIFMKTLQMKKKFVFRMQDRISALQKWHYSIFEACYRVHSFFSTQNKQTRQTVLSSAII